MQWWQILLFPFAILYDIVTSIRNQLYDVGLKRSYTFSEFTIISVGNLSVGGTGKTPMVEYLIRYALEQGWQMAVLSRGYGRKTQGPRVANNDDNAETIGDESMGYYQQFGRQVPVIVAEKRVQGLAIIRQQFPKVQCVILDDAYQHRSVVPDFSILLTTHQKPFWHDYLLPAGRLREARKGYKRADQLVITRCPKENFAQGKELAIPKAHTSVEYSSVQMVHGKPQKKVIAIAGLADNEPFFRYIKNRFELLRACGFSDHHVYKTDQIQRLIAQAKEQEAMIITTQKDKVKLERMEIMSRVCWGFVPIKMTFLDGEEQFLSNLRKHLQ